MAVNHLSFCLSVVLFGCLIMLNDFSLPTEALTRGFIIDLIQRDSPFSPAYNPLAADNFDRLRSAFGRSFSRVDRLYKPTTLLSFSSSSSSSIPIQSKIIPSEGEYLMNVSLGTPPVPVLGIADTGSDLMWTQCKPCTQCFKQNPPMFNPNKSSTYRNIACESKPCSELLESSCDAAAERGGDTCEYRYSYGDHSFTKGNLASDTLTIGSTSLPKIIFGCGRENGGTFDESGSGLIGLGGGPLSLVSQLGKSIGGKFSYCLVPLTSEPYVTSKISFGRAGIVSGPSVVSTPLVAKEPNTFYYLTLEAISVGKKRLVYYHENHNQSKALAGNEGNIIIDSGTTLTFLPVGFHDDLVSALAEAVDAERVSDPKGVLSLCFRAEKESESLASAPIITVHFSGADVVLQPMNTFAKVEDDLFCFTMIPSNDVAIFGNLAQMNFLVGYDLESGIVSFKPTDCTNM